MVQIVEQMATVKTVDQVKDLRVLLDEDMVDAKNKSFVTSLCDQFEKKGSLSEKQEYWVGKMLKQALGITDTETKGSNVVNLNTSFQSVCDLFESASSKLKWPKFKLDVNDLGVVIFRLATGASKNPGSINITSEGEFEKRTWYGRVSPEGIWTVGKAVTEDQKIIINALLVVLAADPVEVVKQFGKDSGSCCFCLKTLTDPASLASGYGPVCAKNYGLPYGSINKIFEYIDKGEG